MADAAPMDVMASNARTRLWGGLLFMICVVALIPALPLAWYGLLWFPGLDGLGQLSATFLVVGPLPLGLGAVFAWRAARTMDRRGLLVGVCFALLAIPVYAVPWAWGGRMLL